MDGDLLDIGRQCSLSSCSQVDFLPIKCRCDLFFCKEHIIPDAHGCRLAATTRAVNDSTLPKFQRCAVPDCSKPSLDAFSGQGSAACPRCSQSFCADHRYPEAHSCSSASSSESTSRNAAAEALIAKHFPATSKASSRRTPKIPTDPVKLAQYQKVELMKMRHRAIPADPKDKPTSVPIGDRLHIKLQVYDSDQEKIFWLRKSIVTGKALDLLATQMKISTSVTKPLQLSDTRDGHILVNSEPLAAQVEDGSSILIGPR
ncbi:uncharacterized protein EV420DRAFT_1631584 [Desarmillaria tabescens]|uniref:AN1-type domain-containing protein n=1 Tax=Armillaria tabescens TaxID=1929756 RepID=A0AA39MPM8_ARMTA|nr:uncharacterized protein EV420DRAFT_1631584 [Desarmillaria tabescens]KAK0441155.1 hypothetical protein EV420DRAFT_1631584 [Desarmillaria tabescens]